MSALPAFHSKAKSESEARAKAAQGELERASSFLEALDALLNEARTPATERDAG